MKPVHLFYMYFCIQIYLCINQLNIYIHEKTFENKFIKKTERNKIEKKNYTKCEKRAQKADKLKAKMNKACLEQCRSAR